MVNGKALREIILTPPFTFQFNRHLKPEDWTNMDQVLMLRQLLKDFSQCKMEKKQLNLSSHWVELRESWQKIFLRDISFKGRMEITKVWNPKKKLKLLEESQGKIRENQATIQAIEELWSNKDQIITH
ncbi:hypothetical protein O181_037670 [Austropuccinia psidii MF-1]|uniref:Uncharacterized protein n=1 Tax=Austropuccinia psidii MF-1 TaxID=1389203 RepID=A0A9Q3D8L1_9BASI|nr:hypothetical protein [Austropuccinia psidii MF-1]